jgi:hypothetical protein
MTVEVIDSLVQENRVMQDQLNQLRYFLVGAHGLKMHVPDVEVGQSIHCGREDIHNIAAGLLLPSTTCADIGPGLRPQRMLECPVHMLIEPWRPYANKLTGAYPGKVVVDAFGEKFLHSALDKSIDTVFLLDVIEHTEKSVGTELIRQAIRVARTQIVIFTPMGFMPHEVHDIPDTWGDVEHGATQVHLSGWLPEEFPGAISVICDDYHSDGDIIYGAFYSIILVEAVQPRLILVSEELPPSFVLRQNDILVVDIRFSELSHLINAVPKRNTLVVPLELIAEQPNTPVDVLQRVIINFPTLRGYLDQFETVEAHGIAARAVLHRLCSHRINQV